MSGKILVADSIATNRIVLRVKLSAAFYQVVLASSCTEVRELMVQEKPDIVLLSDGLADCNLTALVRELCQTPNREKPPVLALLNDAADYDRLSLLQAGATDIINDLSNTQLLLARLRSLTRQRHDLADLDIAQDKAQALGFAEASATFAAQGRFAAVSTPNSRLIAAFDLIQNSIPYCLMRCELSKNGGLKGIMRTPDILIIGIGKETKDEGLAQLAELGIAPDTRQARLIAALEHRDERLAAMSLECGAHDVIDLSMQPAEITFRLDAELARKRANDQLRSQFQSSVEAALRDPLTGLYNRRYGLSQCRRLAERAFDAKQSLVVMVADLDHFKNINDNHGHRAGDIVLTRVAGELSAALGPDDLLARIGGEEFLIVLPNTDRRMARYTAERLCRVVRKMQIAVPDATQPISVTMSLGAAVSEFKPNSDLPNVEHLLNRADQALYSSKSGGRDTVTVCQRNAA
ncbi:MAG: diguanylate cyclase [Pseudomonadota bacterium]